MTELQGLSPLSQAFLQDLPWSRACVWAAAVLAAYQLKDFFGIAMGTFIISFIGNGFVQVRLSALLASSLSTGFGSARIVMACCLCSDINLHCMGAGVS